MILLASRDRMLNNEEVGRSTDKHLSGLLVYISCIDRKPNSNTSSFIFIHITLQNLNHPTNNAIHLPHEAYSKCC